MTQLEGLREKLFTSEYYDRDQAVLTMLADEVAVYFSQEGLETYGDDQRVDGKRMVWQGLDWLNSGDTLTIVGFCGRLSPTVSDELQEEVTLVNDRLIREEMPKIPNLVCYYSRKLDDGNFANFVVFTDPTAKGEWDSALHDYAAHELSPRYYDEVLLYNGEWVFQSQELTLMLLKYFNFETYERGDLPL